ADLLRTGGGGRNPHAHWRAAAHRGTSDARATRGARRAVPTVQGRTALCDTGDQPADRRRAVPERRRGQDAPADAVSQTRHRAPAPEPEAGTAGRDGAAVRTRLDA